MSPIMRRRRGLISAIGNSCLMRWSSNQPSQTGDPGVSRSLPRSGFVQSARLPYVLIVAPLAADLTSFGRPLAMIVLTDPDECSSSDRELAEFFGLSPAESRLAVALLAGK